MKPGEPLTTLRARRVEHILAAMEGKTVTRKEIAAAVHMHERKAHDYISYLRGMRQVYISKWVRTSQSGSWTPCFRLGSRPDAQMPESLARAEISRRYRANLAKDFDRADRSRARRAARSMPIKADPLTFAFYYGVAHERSPEI